jgi:RsiW-degrading membrane proteinase PrsW (M82 family)
MMNYANIILAILISILPALFWLIIYYKKDKLDPEPKTIILKTFIVGALSAAPFLALHFGILYVAKVIPAWIQGALGIIVFAGCEEMAKLAASVTVVLRHRKAFNQVIDGVVYGVTAALGFAFIENIFYFITLLGNNLNTNSLYYPIIFRSFGSMLAHTLFSAITGLIWAYAYFSKEITPFSKKHLLAFELKDFINREILSFHIIRKNVLKALPSRRGGHEKKALVLEGLLLATLFHAIYNILTIISAFGQNLTFLIVPGVIAGFFAVSYWFTKKLNNKIYKVV